MITLKKILTSHMEDDEKNQRENLRNLITQSLARSDHEAARHHAGELYRLETQILIRQQTYNVIRSIAPMRNALWLSGGLLIGSILMLLLDVKFQFNLTLLFAAVIAVSFIWTTILGIILLNEHRAKKLLRHTEQTMDNGISGILSSHDADPRSPDNPHPRKSTQPRQAKQHRPGKSTPTPNKEAAMTINGREFTVGTHDVNPESTDIDSGYHITSKRGIRYNMFRNNHDRNMLFAIPENFMKHAIPHIWVREEQLALEAGK